MSFPARVCLDEGAEYKQSEIFVKPIGVVSHVLDYNSTQLRDCNLMRDTSWWFRLSFILDGECIPHCQAVLYPNEVPHTMVGFCCLRIGEGTVFLEQLTFF